MQILQYSYSNFNQFEKIHIQKISYILSDNQDIPTHHYQPIQGLQPNFTTDGIRIFMAQQKQRKQLILTNNKIISTYLF